jgi:hypothetical protein
MCVHSVVFAAVDLITKVVKGAAATLWSVKVAAEVLRSTESVGWAGMCGAGVMWAAVDLITEVVNGALVVAAGAGDGDNGGKGKKELHGGGW